MLTNRKKIINFELFSCFFFESLINSKDPDPGGQFITGSSDPDPKPLIFCYFSLGTLFGREKRNAEN
jgi:hypothetical protein